MGKLKYLFSRFKKMDFKRLFSTIKETGKKSGKGVIFVTIDMLGCAIKYTAAPADYALFEFYNLKPKQRKTYITRGINNDFIKKHNDRKKVYLLDNKAEFNKLYREFLNREYILVGKDNFHEFESFLKRHTEIIVKPLELSCGYGIKKIALAEFESARAMFESIVSDGEALAEEIIVQHEKMAELHPLSVNTLRLATVTVDNKTEIIYGFIRIGNGRVVDNLNSGGMAAPLDVNTGEVLYPAADKNFYTFVNHPATGAQIVGFVPPFFKEAQELVKKAAKKCDGLGYVGWDVAIMANGPCLIEGNAYPGHDILQLPPHVPNKIGLKSRIEKYL